MTDAELYTLLTGDTGITAITTRIYNGNLPEGATLPAVTFDYIADTPYNTISGDTGKSRDRYSVSAWASSGDAALSLEAAIRTALAAYPRQSREPLHEPEYRLFRYAIDYSFFT